MHRCKRLVATFASLALLATLVVAATATAAGAVTITLPCSADAPIVGAQPFNQDISVSATAPSQVAPGATFPVSYAVSSVIPSSVSTSAGDVTINSIRSFVLKLPVPANATYVSSSVTGGGTVNLEGGNLVVRVPGPVSGGATATFPVVNVVLTASGALNSTVTPRLGGSSLADPALTFTINANAPVIGNTDINATCAPPAPNPALSTTTIAADTTAPTVNVTVPADGGSYLLGAQVLAAYSCADELYGSGLASCVGSAANGAAIDTASLGAKTFTVTGTDAANNPTVVTRSYTVIPPAGDQTAPSITITTPADGAVVRQGQAVAASYSCSDPSGVLSCTGSVANGSLIDTGTPGGKTFTATSLDNAGNPRTKVHSYRVLAGSASTIGPFNAGTMTGGAVNTDGTTATVKVTAPTSNGGQLKVGDTFTVDWSIYRPRRGVGYTSNWGPDPLNWTLPAPTNAVINGPVLVDENGLNGETRSNAHQGGDATGLKSISPSANPSNASQITVVTDQNSVPAAVPIQDGDGVLAHVRFTAVVTAPGPVTVQGFPALTGYDCGAFGVSCGNISTDQGINPPGISFSALDVTPPGISLSSPGDGALYAPGSVVNAAFSCTDAVTCVGDVANGGVVDTSLSGPRQFHVTATDAAGNVAERWVTYTVVAPTVSASTCSGVEVGTCTFTISLSNASQKTVTVDYSTTAGTAGTSDYVPVSGQATFAPGQTSRTLSVTLSDDALDEPDETFNLTLSNPANAYLGTSGVGTIVDGSVTLVARFAAENEPVLQAAAAEFFLPYSQLGQIGTQFFRFIHALGGSQGSPVTPPDNVGPVVFTATYTQAEAALINAVAAQYGLNADELQWMGIALIAFVAAIN